MKNAKFVLKILKENDNFLSVKDIQEQLTFFGVKLSRATLYKILTNFMEMGFIFNVKVSKNNKKYYKLEGFDMSYDILV